MPKHCITQGLATILEAKHVVLIANGHQKARAVSALVEGPVSSRWPSTVLQHHPHVTVIIDEAAASMLELSDYYRYVFAEKPVPPELVARTSTA